MLRAAEARQSVPMLCPELPQARVLFALYAAAASVSLGVVSSTTGTVCLCAARCASKN
jgi:hypothetical protein